MILFIAFVFIQSLYFKFLNSPETIYIFQEKLNPWSYELTGYNLFAPTGIFSQYVVGSAELVNSLLLLLSLIPRLAWIRAIGALGSMAVMGGAIFFHLWPLGIQVRNVDGSYDGGMLFMMACLNFLFGAYLLLRNHQALRTKFFG